ncbi:MAG: membrane protein insertase YidC [Schleiferiaceae bacterium]|nr:membrane protein insertase YidC [Schleiferiaceae bacterium]
MEKKTDRNQIYGFVLIGLILVFFSWYNTTLNPAVEAKPGSDADTVEATSTPANTATAPSTAIESEATELAAIDTTAAAALGQEEQRYVLDNNLMRLEFSSKGGMPVYAELFQYKTYQDYASGDSIPLKLIEENGHFSAYFGEDMTTAKMNFDGVVTTESGNQVLRMTAAAPGGGSVQWVYTLYPDKYDFDIQLLVQDLQGEVANAPVYLRWNQLAMRHEKSLKAENMATQIYYYRENDYHTLSAGSSSKKEKDQVKWVGYKQQFFSAILKSDGLFTNAVMESAEIDNDDNYTKAFGSVLTAGNMQNGNLNLPLNMYLGPNKYEILREYPHDYDKVIDFGWGIFGWIGRGVVVKIFNWLDNYHINYGIIILIMALMIKIVLFPFMFSSYKSMAKMRVLKPEMDELNEKFKDKDPMQKQQAVMQLYQKAGVNPLAGCLPQLVQLPILIAMFRFFPASIELRQKAFLWADDLSSFDVIVSWDKYVPLLSDFYGNHISLFTLLMAASTFAYTMLNNQLQGSNQQFPQLKYIMYLMPVMLLFWFNSYASGLSYYYFIANITTFAQQFGIRGFLDDKAILAKIQENKKKPKKKSRFSKLLEEQMDKQKEQANVNRRIRRGNQ